MWLSSNNTVIIIIESLKYIIFNIQNTDPSFLYMILIASSCNKIQSESLCSY